MANLNFLGIVIVALLTNFMTHSATNDVAINIVAIISKVIACFNLFDSIL